MSEELRQEARRLLSDTWQRKLGRFTVSMDCDCGQKLIITASGQLGAFVASLAGHQDAAILEANESATCPTCGALVFSEWNASAGRAFSMSEQAIEQTVQELADVGRLQHAVEELQAEANEQRQREIEAN